MQPMQIKALELEQSVLEFLNGVIADYGVYIFMGLVSSCELKLLG
jgi:hypothetical protein